MNMRRGASVGSVVLALVGIGVVGAAGWAAMSGVTPCDIIGSCSIGATKATATGASPPAASTVQTSTATETTPSCCELGSLAEQTDDNPAAGGVIPASLDRAGEPHEACASEGCDPANCAKGDACCQSGASAEKPDTCCAGEHG